MKPARNDLAELAALDRKALGERWSAAFRCPVPRSAPAVMLRRALAWHLQMQASPEWRDAAAVARLMRSLRPATPAPALSPGTRLMREWQDRTHHVTVLVDGFDYEGVPYRSLSAIARRITGTPWSGPAFFGLKS